MTAADPFGFCSPTPRTPANATTTDYRVLLIAEACNPEWVSVPLVGYNMYAALRTVADVTLVTQVRNRGAMERRCGSNANIVFIDSERLAAPFHNFGKWLTLGRGAGWTTRQALMWLPYVYFERLVYEHFATDLAQGRFDLIHRVTPLTPTYPSPLSCWTDVPMVLGPLNGGLPWPAGTTRRRWAEMEWLSYVRNAYRVLPYMKRTYARAAQLVAGSLYTLSSFPAQARARSVFIPENGIDTDRFNPDGRAAPSQISPFTILFVGRLVPYKGADLVLQAVIESEYLSDARIVLVGDGPQRKQLEELATHPQLRRRVEFIGNVPQPEVPQYFRSASIFAFPSLREFGGGVVIEAMACGLPSIVVNHGGPTEHITADTGFKIPLGPRQALIDGVRQTLESACTNRQQLDAMSHAGWQRIRQLYTWPRKAGQICTLYNQLLSR